MKVMLIEKSARLAGDYTIDLKKGHGASEVVRFEDRSEALKVLKEDDSGGFEKVCIGGGTNNVSQAIAVLELLIKTDT